MDMKSWASDLAKAIPLRHSARAFQPDPLPEGVVKAITAFADGLALPFEHDVKVRLFKADPGKKLYNNGINPVNNLALRAQTDLVSISKAGFIGELIMLYAVKQGLSTCWFGHYKLSEVGRYIEGIAGADRIKESTLGYGYGKHVDVGERVICCMPFGHKNEATKRLVDVVAGSGAQAASRLKASWNIQTWQMTCQRKSGRCWSLRKWLLPQPIARCGGLA